MVIYREKGKIEKWRGPTWQYRLWPAMSCYIVESREGWPLLTAVETEVNGDTKSTNESGPFLVGSLGLSCRYKRFLFYLGCSSRPSTKYYSNYFRSFVPIAQQSGPASALGLLSVIVCVSG